MRFVPIGAKKISEGNIFEHKSEQISQKDLWTLSETNPKLRLLRMSTHCIHIKLNNHINYFFRTIKVHIDASTLIQRAVLKNSTENS